MTHFGLICPGSPGHLNGMIALSHELKQRGHSVTMIGPVDDQEKAIAAGLNFCVIGEFEYPKGAIPQILARKAQLKGLGALQYAIKELGKEANVMLRDAPTAIRKAGIEALLIDQIILPGETLAEFLDIPFVTVCSQIMVNREDRIPPYFTHWNYNPAWWACLRNQASWYLLYQIARPIRQIVNEYRQQWKLPAYTYSSEPYSKLLQLGQLPAEFEFPRQNLPQCFHFTGPLLNPTSRKAIPFPYDKLTGQPLIYASLGTIQNGLLWIFQTIAEACTGIDAQLVLSLGGAADPKSFPKLPGDPLIVKYAPQLELLQKASLTITHAGRNTALESLNSAVPMVAIPIGTDQPGVAARIAWTGTGEMVPLSRLNVPRLRAAIQRVLTEDSYKKNAFNLQQAIRRAGGVSRAANLVEQAVSTGKPVLRVETDIEAAYDALRASTSKATF